MGIPNIFYFVVDNDPRNCSAARGNDPSATVVDGDSGSVLPLILADLDSSALFWLDAHSWVGPEFGDNPPGSPLLAELDAILAWPHAATSVVLVDDLRLMDPPLLGWPTLASILSRTAIWECEEADDILRLTPLA